MTTRRLFDTGRRFHGQPLYAEALTNGRTGFELTRRDWLDSVDPLTDTLCFHSSEEAARAAFAQDVTKQVRSRFVSI